MEKDWRKLGPIAQALVIARFLKAFKRGDTQVMSALLQTYLRSLLKMAGAALFAAALQSAVTHGHIDQPMASAISAAVAGGDWATVIQLLGGVGVAWVGLYLSHRLHKDEPPKPILPPASTPTP